VAPCRFASLGRSGATHATDWDQMFARILGLFSADMAIDLGTANTLV
jgi:hypothetical protein